MNDAGRESSVALWALSAVTAYVAIQGAVYFLYKISALTVFACAAFVLAGIFALNRKEILGWRPARLKIVWDWRLVLGAAFILSDAAFFAICIRARTEAALSSPWQAIPGPALALFAIATSMLVWLGFNVSRRIFSALLAIHVLAAYGIAETVFAYGFGFDPFIHRATEEHIAANGFILPKKPFYNGQYVLVIALHWATRLPLDWVDRALVPICASLALPPIITRTLSVPWLKLGERQHVWAVGLLLFPMLPLTFTTPNNLTVLSLICAAFLLPLFGESRAARWALTGTLAAGAIIHPMIGSVALALAAAVFICRKAKWPALGAVAGALISSVAVPALIAANNWRGYGKLLLIEDFWNRWPMFLRLFQNPYGAFAGPKIGGWDFLYGYYEIMPLILVAFALIGTRHWSTEGRGRLALAYWSAAFGTIIAAGVLAMGIFLPDVISSEQTEFSLRLVHASGLLLMPLFLSGLAIAARGLLRMIPRLAPAACAALAAAAVVSVFLTYPQWNERVKYPGWGVSRADFDAAQLIRERAEGKKYVALSDQMLSVAALRAYGFENFHYAIPTGGELYAYFIEMAHYRTGRETMEEAMDYAGAEIAYFAVSDYYPGYEWLRQAAAAEADAAWELGGRVSVFEFAHGR